LSASTQPHTSAEGIDRAPLRGSKLQKLLEKRLRVPGPVAKAVLSATDIARHPREYRLRRRLARDLKLQSAETEAILPENGFRCFSKEEFEGTADVVQLCDDLFEKERRERDFEALISNPKKRFLLGILDAERILAHPTLLSFMVSRPIIDVAANYLGTIPRLAGARLWWSPSNDTAHASQLLHYDFEDSTQLKVFVHVRDVAQDQGPLTFLPASLSARVPMPRGRSSRATDQEALAALGGGDPFLRLLGPAGSGGFLDTSRCLHQGSRQNRRERLVFMFSFLRRHSPYQTRKAPTVPLEVHAPLALDQIQRLVLGLV
jgi:hypothetical protein